MRMPMVMFLSIGAAGPHDRSASCQWNKPSTLPPPHVVQVWSSATGNECFIGFGNRNTARSGYVMAGGHTKAMHHGGSTEAHRLRASDVPVVATAQVAGNRGSRGRIGHGGTCGRRVMGRS